MNTAHFESHSKLLVHFAWGLLLLSTLASTSMAVISFPVTDDAYAANDPNRGPTVGGDRNEAGAFFEVRHHSAPRKKIGYLKYGVGGFSPDVYATATLSGEFISTTYDSPGTWNVYGLNDGELNLDNVPDGTFGELNWTEEGLSYSKGLGVDVSIPASPDTDLGLDLTEITFLGTITIPGDSPFVSNPTELPLGSFLSSDTNGVVTFLIADAGFSGNEWRVKASENTSSPGVLLNIECNLGDTNCDGVVDLETDLAAIAANFRQNVAGRIDGDLTFDQVVDFDDFDEWKRNFTGSLADADLSFLAVPEPHSLLLMLGAVPLFRSRMWRKS